MIFDGEFNYEIVCERCGSTLNADLVVNKLHGEHLSIGPCTNCTKDVY